MTTVTAVAAPEFSSDVKVDLIDHMGSEASIVMAARVSTLGSKAEAAESAGLLRYLYDNGHASPFEHCVSSFNEESGRYSELTGKFYLPSPERPMVQVGKVGKYEFTKGSPEQQQIALDSIHWLSSHAWIEYRDMLDNGISREVARMVLPVNTYSTIYYTANLRSILNFLSLRVDWGPEATYRSKPQHEIELVALEIAAHIQLMFPVVFDLFRKNGYVAV